MKMFLIICLKYQFCFFLKKVNIFIFCEEENTRSFVCKIFQKINTVKIEWVRTVKQGANS